MQGLTQSTRRNLCTLCENPALFAVKNLKRKKGTNEKI